jgi:hypothetical protein
MTISSVLSPGLGSARVPRAGFGVAPKRTFPFRVRNAASMRKSPRTRDAFASARDGRATQTKMRA